MMCTIAIFIFHNFFISLARSKYFSIFILKSYSVVCWKIESPLTNFLFAYNDILHQAWNGWSLVIIKISKNFFSWGQFLVCPYTIGICIIKCQSFSQIVTGIDLWMQLLNNLVSESLFTALQQVLFYSLSSTYF